MKSFSKYLQELEKLKKEKKFNEAWKLANEAMADFAKKGDKYWYDFYYQLADIAAREKKWESALFHMGLVVHYNKGVGGTSHTQFIVRLLKKFKKEAFFDDFIKLSIFASPEEIRNEMKNLLNK